MKDFKSIDDILDFAMNSEQEAVDFYTSLAENASNEEMKNVFTQFAAEEMGHKAKLRNVKETGKLRFKNGDVPDLKIADYIVDVEPKPDITYPEALVLAMKREKNAFKLYMDLSEKADDEEIKTLFISLAQEESIHKLRFELEYDEYVLREN